MANNKGTYIDGLSMLTQGNDWRLVQFWIKTKPGALDKIAKDNDTLIDLQLDIARAFEKAAANVR